MDTFQLLRRHEGERLTPYCDKCAADLVLTGRAWTCTCSDNDVVPGNITIGVGRNLSANGIQYSESQAMLNYDIGIALLYLHNWIFFDRLDPVRQASLIDLCVNLGAERFDMFTNMIGCLKELRLVDAASAMRASLADHQEPNRIAELAMMLETGRWPSGPYL